MKVVRDASVVLFPAKDAKWIGTIVAMGMTTLLAASTLLGHIYFLFPLLPLVWLWPMAFRRAMDVIIGFWFLLPVTLVEKLFGVQVRMTGDRVESGQPALIVMNHRTRLDWFFLWLALFRQDPRLMASEKISLKQALRYIPGAGWAMALNAFLFLQRCFERDRERIDRTLAYYSRMGANYQLLFFPEGTDKCSRTTERSVNYALQHGLQRYDYVLHPRTTGFVHLVRTMRDSGQLACIYDVTVAYPHTLVQSEVALFTRGLCPSAIHFNFRRVPLDELPQSDDELEQWLKARWAEKEQLLHAFYGESNAELRGFPGLPIKNRFHALQWAIVVFWLGATAGWIHIFLTWPYQAWYGLVVVSFLLCAKLLYGGIEELYLSVA